MRVCLLASGSKGNAIYVESGQSRILVDAGLSARELNSRLGGIGVDGEQLDALVVSHEHSDHCRGLGPMCRRFDLPVFIHPETHAALPKVGRISDLRMFETGDSLDFRDLRIETFSVTHDAAAPVGFVIDSPEGKIGIATDLGIATRLVSQRLRDCRVLVLEFNHDERMLLDGPYPWHLKQRVRSNHGHLSNGDSAKMLQELVWDGLEAVFLAHMSETNNHPSLAEGCAMETLGRQQLCRPEVISGCQSRASLCFGG